MKTDCVKKFVKKCVEKFDKRSAVKGPSGGESALGGTGRVFYIFVLSMILFGSLGCDYVALGPQTSSSEGDNQKLVRELFINKYLIVPDLPFPAGFDLDGARSRTIATHGNIRMIDHIYVGRGDQNAAGRFFRREMPRKGWTSASERSARDELRLNFVKGRERCEVNIAKGSFGRLEVDVSVYPENPAAAP